MPRVVRSDVRLALILTALLAVSLFTNLSFLINSPEYTYPDSDTYLVPAQHMLHGRGFTDALEMPDTLRTPGYPVALMPLLAFGAGVRGIVLAQHLLNVVMALVIFAILWRLTGSLAAASATAFLFAIDPTTLRYSNRVLTETLFTAILFLVFAWLRLGAEERRFTRPHAAAIGLACGVLALVRPAAIFFFVPAAAYIFITWRRRRAAATIAFVIGSLLLPAVWTARNFAQTGVATFCSIGATDLLLYRAAGVLAIDEPGDFRANQTREQIRLIEQAESELSAEQQTDDPGTLAHAIQARKQMEIAKPILLSHPLQYVRLMMRGYRVLLLENDSEAVEMAAPDQDEVAIRRVVIAYTWTMLVLAILGIVPLFRRDWRLALLSMLTIAYFLTITAGGEAESRFRTPVVPQYALLASSVLLFGRSDETSS